MSIFAPIWKTKDKEKKSKAVLYVRKVNDVRKLKKIILYAPISAVRAKAILQLNDITGGDIPLDAAESMQALLLLDVDDFKVLELYSRKLFSCLSDEDDFRKIALEAKNEDIRDDAVRKIENKEYLTEIIWAGNMPELTRRNAIARIQDEKILEKAAVDKTLPEKLRIDAIKKVKDQELLSEIAWSKSSWDMRIAAVENIKDREELVRIREGSDSTTVRQCACGRLGHKMGFVEYKPHGRDGRDAVYKCETCGEEKVEPYEWSTADSV